MMDGHAHTHCQGDPQLYVVGKNLTYKPPLVGPWVLNAWGKKRKNGKNGGKKRRMNLPLKTAAHRKMKSPSRILVERVVCKSLPTCGNRFETFDVWALPGVSLYGYGFIRK